MPTKSFSVYSNNDHYQPTENDHLIIEAGNGYTTFMVKNRTDQVNAIEWFNYKKAEEETLEELFVAIGKESGIIDQQFLSTQVFINNDLSVLVPSSLFNEKNLSDYLNVGLGETVDAGVSFDRISAQSELINVYRYEPGMVAFLQSRFQFSSIKHAYSPLLSKWLNLKNLPGRLMNVMFYNSHFVVSLFREGKFMLMRSFIYHSAEDVIYYLLSLAETFDLDTDAVLIKVSGFIDIPSTMHTQLTRFFKNVSIDTIHLGKINLRNEKYPLHYFTPVFNLAI